MSAKPTFEQAQLHLQVYDQRREARLRQARDWFFKNYFADNWGALLNYGLLHDDLFFETSGEFFGVWERIKPTIAEGREQWANKQFLGNMEQAAQRYEVWIEKRSPGHLAKMREFMKQMRPQSAKAA